MALENGILYQSEHKTAKGIVRVVLDVTRIQKDLDDITTKLMQARGIPMDQENLSQVDPLVRFVVTSMPWIPPDKVMWTASERYITLAKEASNHAALIATTRTSDREIFTGDPEPWPKETNEDFGIEGDVSFPEVEYNILHPVERRLKQLVDVLATIPEAMYAIGQATNTALIAAQRGSPEVDEDGFQPKLASKPVRGKAVPPSVEPTAEA